MDLDKPRDRFNYTTKPQYQSFNLEITTYNLNNKQTQKLFCFVSLFISQKHSDAGSPSISVVGTSSASNSTPTKSSNWVTPGQDNRKNAWGTADKKKKKKNKGSGVFAAMMANDDSDSDVDADDHVEPNDSDDEQAAATTPTKGAAATADDSSPAADNNSKKKKSKKKKSKGGGKKKKDEANMTEDELLNASVAANKALEKEKEEGEEVSHPAIAFLKNYLIPFILGFITFLFSLFFGKPKKQKKK